MQPTIGRIVLYNHPGSADGTYPPTQSPAIIQKVYEDKTAISGCLDPKDYTRTDRTKKAMDHANGLGRHGFNPYTLDVGGLHSAGRKPRRFMP